MNITPIKGKQMQYEIFILKNCNELTKASTIPNKNKRNEKVKQRQTSFTSTR